MSNMFLSLEQVVVSQVGEAVKAVDQFGKYGGYIGTLTGTLVVTLFIAVVILWRSNNAKQLLIEVNQQKFLETLTSLQDTRVTEAKEVAEKTRILMEETNKTYHELTSALTNLKDVILAKG